MFNPNFITKLITTALIIPMGFGAMAPEAEASTCFDSSVTGGTICNTFLHSNGYGDVYSLGYAIGGTRESMVVVCNGAQVIDWKSSGTITQRGAQRLANHFCGI